MLREFLEHRNELFSRFIPSEAANAEQASRLIARSFESDGKLYICGGGLSSHFVRYIAALFNHHYAGNRPSLPAIALDSTSLCNDDNIFTRQLSALITDKDILFGVAARPPYEPLQNAFRSASDNGAKNIALIGSGGNRLKNLCDVFIEANLKNYLDIQEIHIFFLHAVCEMVGALMFRQV
ncbi:MAG: SIS domain-containing protein [Deferribacteraceae bacterium]|nr:SIS domain-containing protein [Deferribacteraceae bacterium]